MTCTDEILDNIPKRVIRKRKKDVYYPVDKLYYAEVDGEECIICETYINHKPRYIELITINNYTFINKILGNNFKIIKSLKEEIDSKNVNVCLLNLNGKYKREITIDKLINIIKLIKALEKESFDFLDNICINIVNKISDLLGININCNPSSNLKIKDTEEVIVPATKVLRFKNLLLNYIKISIVLNGSTTISNNDYRVISALINSKIKTPEYENQFVITVNSNGEETLECENLEEAPQQKSYQKTNKYKKA